MNWIVFYAIATTSCLGVIVWNLSGIYRRLRRLEGQVGLFEIRCHQQAFPCHQPEDLGCHEDRYTPGESLLKERFGNLCWVDDETRGPMLKPAAPKRGDTH